MSLLIAVDLRPLIESFESGVTVFTKEMVKQFQHAFRNKKDENLLLFYQSRKRCPRIHKLFPDAKHIPVSTTVHRLWSLFGFPRLPDGYFEVAGVKRKPDLIFLPDRRPFYKTDIPLVLMVHDLVPEKYAKTLSWKGRLWFRIFSLKRLLGIADGVLTPTLSIANELQAYLSKQMKRIGREVIYEGAELVARPAMPDGAKGLSKKPFFFMLSPADPRKRAEWLIEMARRFPRVNFAIVGLKKGDNRFAWRAGQGKKLKNLFIFGQVSEAEKLWFFKNAEGLLALSKYEGFDLPVLEAVQAKCPVIMSDIPVHRELYKDATFVRDLSGLQVAIYNALRDNGSRKLHVPNARGKYTWEAAAQRALLFFRGIIANKNR